MSIKFRFSVAAIWRTFALTAATVLINSIAAPSATAGPVPAPAAQAGYNLNSFSSDFTKSSFDVDDSKNRGFSWYFWDLFGYQADPKGVQLNPDGSVTLDGDSSGASGQIVSAVQYRATNSFVGTAFGGGAYIEAELKFDPQAVNKAANKHFWPAFWGLPMEGNLIAGAAQWKGQPNGYMHAVETDFMEAFPNQPAPNRYGGSMHDWYGIMNETCGHGLCQVGMPYSMGMRVTPIGTDFTQFHRYGFLWIPATAQARGYAKFYFDGEQVGAPQEWDKFQDQAPDPVNKPWAFGVLDQQHMFLILGTGKNQPMTVRSVNVWQSSTSENRVN